MLLGITLKFASVLRDRCIHVALFHFFIVKTDSLHIQVITVINSDNPFYGYSAAAPVFEVAFKQMRELYPRAFANVTRHSVHSTSNVTCPEGDTNVPLISRNISEILKLNSPSGLSVLFCPGCSLEITALGDFAREWNVPLFSSLGSDPSLADKRRYPTVTTFPTPDHRTIPIAVHRFLRMHQWRTISLLCDSLTQSGAMGTFYLLSCNTIKKKLNSPPGDFQPYMIPFDSGSNNTKSYSGLLQQVRQLSRVIVVFTLPKLVRKFMVAAHRLNMTDGSYVYLSPQTTQVPNLGNFTWQNFDAEDEEANQAFGSLIEIINPNPDWEKITPIIDSISETTRSKFNRTLKGNERYNDLAISVYEAYEVFAAVLNESYDELVKGDATGWKFSQRFWNRRFDYPARPVILNDKGLRMNDVQFFRKEPVNRSLLETWRYEVVTDSLSVTRPALAALWLTSSGRPPPDIPFCGFKGDLCRSTEVASVTTSAASITVASLLAALLGLLLGIRFLHSRNHDERIENWWVIDTEELGQSKRKPTLRVYHLTSTVTILQGNLVDWSIIRKSFIPAK